MAEWPKAGLFSGFDFSSVNFSFIFDNFHEGVLVTDTAGKIVYYNHAQGVIDGISPEAALGKTISEVYEFTDVQSNTMRCLRIGAPVLHQFIAYRTKGGGRAKTISSAFPVQKNGRLFGAVCFTQDFNRVIRLAASAGRSSFGKKTANCDTRYDFDCILGKSPRIEEAVRIAKMVAPSPSSVMLFGESGTGKEIFAQAIHHDCRRVKKRFVPINCAAIPETLLEAMLFGTVKGAFTGAFDRAGLFEKAQDGTIFLDEVNSMPVALQSKLLRVLQEKKVSRLGASAQIPLNVRIISSTKDDPRQAVAKGSLRNDVFYRLAVVMIHLPPLRERKEDLEMLAQHFMEINNRRLQKRVRGISGELAERLYAYHWPGNIRELEHVIEGAMNISGDDPTLGLEHLPAHIRNDPSSTLMALPPDGAAQKEERANLATARDRVEKEMIVQALGAARGNVSRASRLMGLASPQALHYKLKKHGLDPRTYAKTPRPR